MTPHYIVHPMQGHTADDTLFLLGSWRGAVKSSVKKRSVVIGGRKTSISLEEPFWNGIKEFARARGTTLSAIVEGIDAKRRHDNLSSAIRLYVLDAYREQIATPQARKAKAS